MKNVFNDEKERYCERNEKLRSSGKVIHVKIAELNKGRGRCFCLALTGLVQHNKQNDVLLEP